MTWNNTSPGLTNSIAADIPDILENFQHSHDASGNVDTLASTCKINSNGILEGDTTSGRVLRMSQLSIIDGTNANTLKCTLTSIFNGDAIVETNNVAKNATTGNFTLDSDGYLLTVEAAGLSGNAVGAIGVLTYNDSETSVLLQTLATANDLTFRFRPDTQGSTGSEDMTALVDEGSKNGFRISIIYVTDA